MTKIEEAQKKDAVIPQIETEIVRAKKELKEAQDRVAYFERRLKEARQEYPDLEKENGIFFSPHHKYFLVSNRASEKVIYIDRDGTTWASRLYASQFKLQKLTPIQHQKVYDLMMEMVNKNGNNGTSVQEKQEGNPTMADRII